MIALLFRLPRVSDSTTKIAIGFLSLWGGVIEVLRIQEKVIMRRAIYHYYRCQVKVQWCMQLRHPNKLVNLSLVLTWPNQFNQALAINFHCSTIWKHEKTQKSTLSLYLSKGWKCIGFWCPLQSRIGIS